MNEKIPVSAELMDAYQQHTEKFGLLPIKVSPYYKSLVEEEMSSIGPGGPLYRSVYPEAQRVSLTAPFEVPDFVTDEDNMQEGAVHTFIQKYANRVLMLTTDNCFSNCQYCFRTNLLDEESKIILPSLEQKSQIVADAVRNNPAVEEVILSGGDPLTIGVGGLDRIFSTIKAARDDIRFRVHTRAITYAPHVFKPDLVDTLREYDVRTFFHINHPYEITDQQRAVFHRMHEAGLRMYNQSPVLRGINDHERVLGRLVTQLEDEHVRHVSFFIADPICFSADFRVPLARLYEISDILQWSLSSWSANFRLVLDTPFGKVRREDIVSWDKQSGTVVFRREGHDVVYHDLPQGMYIPGDVSKMMWKDVYAEKS